MIIPDMFSIGNRVTQLARKSNQISALAHNLQCRYLSDKEKDESEKKVAETTKPSNKHRGRAGDKLLTKQDKLLLSLSGRWKRNEIPDSISDARYQKDMWMARIRISTIMMIIWLLVCLLIVRWGKGQRKEKQHRLVMQQYLDRLPEDERKAFIAEYNLDEKTLSR